MTKEKEEECDGLLEESRDDYMQERAVQKQRLSATMVLWISCPCIFLLGLAAGWFARSHSYSMPYAYDPTIRSAEALAKPIHRVTNVSAGPGDYSDVFSRPPSKELDDAWESLYTNSLLLITERDVRRMGKNPAVLSHIPLDEDFGYGDKKYLAKFDHIHAIHCLNLIRKWVHSDHYFPHGKPRTIGLVHVDHCIRSVLENLRCHVNYGLFTYKWYEGEGAPMADFEVDRQCRDYDALLDFARENRVDYDARVTYLPRPPSAVVFPQDPTLAKFDAEWLKAHPDVVTMQQRIEPNRKKYEAAVKEWRETGRVPMVEAHMQDP